MADIAESIKKIKAAVLEGSTAGKTVALSADQSAALETGLKSLSESMFGKEILVDEGLTTQLASQLKGILSGGTATEAVIKTALKDVADTGMVAGFHDKLAGHTDILASRKALARAADGIKTELELRDLRTKAYKAFDGASSSKVPSEILTEMRTEVTRLSGVATAAATKTPEAVAKHKEAQALLTEVEGIFNDRGLANIRALGKTPSADEIAKVQTEITHALEGIRGEAEVNYKYLTGKADAILDTAKAEVLKHNGLLKTHVVEGFHKPIDIKVLAESAGITMGADGKIASFASSATKDVAGAGEKSWGFWKGLIKKGDEVTKAAEREGKPFVMQMGEGGHVSGTRVGVAAAAAALLAAWAMSGKSDQQAHGRS